MPWNTVDMLTMMPRAAEAGDYAGREMAGHQHVHDSAAAAVQQNVEQKAVQTVETQKSETEEYDMDQGGGRGAYQQNRKHKKEEKKDEAPMAPKSDSMFDIMI
ncbi:MAG: hypothetical protein K5639_05540 [Eubacterium sp.]|nr:hypothetical protein [Eubacterium sp.]